MHRLKCSYLRRMAIWNCLMATEFAWLQLWSFPPRKLLLRIQIGKTRLLSKGGGIQ